MYVADSNVLIGFANDDYKPEFMDWFSRSVERDQIYISTLNRAEFLAKPGLSTRQEIAYKTFLEQFLSFFT